MDQWQQENENRRTVNGIARKPGITISGNRDYGPQTCPKCGQEFRKETYNAKKCPNCRNKLFLTSSPMKPTEHKY